MPFLWDYHLQAGQWQSGTPVALPAGWTPLTAERRFDELVVLLWRPADDPVDPSPGGPPSITECYPNPIAAGAEVIVGGSDLDSCVKVEIVPEGQAAVSVLPPWELQTSGSLRFVVPPGLPSGPATLAAYDAADQTTGPPFGTSIA